MADTNTFDSLPAACQEALASSLRLDGGTPSPEMAAHAAGCAVCRKLLPEMTNMELELAQSFSAVQAPPDFAAQTLARIRAAGKQPAAAAALRVYAPPQSRLSFLTRGRIAAAVAAAVLLGVAGAAAMLISRSAPTVAVAKGVILDASGHRMAELQSAAVYVARESAVLPVGEKAMVKAEAGAQFRLHAVEDDASRHRVELLGGDLYAAAREGSAPVQVACAHFDTELMYGHMFVAQENAGVVRGIVMVFEGAAQVHPQREAAVALLPGQIYYSVGHEDGISGELVLSDDLQRLGAARPLGASPDVARLRTEYATRVTDYQKELAQLDAHLAKAQPASLDHADLSDRRKRVETYLQAHRSRLIELSPARQHIPLEKIESGRRGRTDPLHWL